VILNIIGKRAMIDFKISAAVHLGQSYHHGLAFVKVDINWHGHVPNPQYDSTTETKKSLSYHEVQLCL
jgi:hypothetical protein